MTFKNLPTLAALNDTERFGWIMFWSDKPLAQALRGAPVKDRDDIARGWWSGHRLAYGRGFAAGSDPADIDQPYERFSAAGEAWAAGHDDGVAWLEMPDDTQEDA